MKKAITILKEFAKLLGFTEEFKSFGNIRDVNISQNTQQSIDMTKLENLTNLTRSTNFSIGRTHFHNQKDSQLCHSFAAVSALRAALLKYLKDILTGEEFQIIKRRRF